MREIDDSDSVLDIKKLKTEAEADPYLMTEQKLGDVFQHEKLFENYPKLKDVNVVYESPKGIKEEDLYYGASYDKSDNTIILGNGLDDKEMKSAILHEVQHSIQDIEKWASGGSVQEFEQLLQVKKDFNNVNMKITDFEEKFDFDNFKGTREEFRKTLSPAQSLSYDRMSADRDDLYKVLQNNGKFDRADTPFNNYKKLWGEQQARATQARVDMTPEQRASEDWTQTLERIEGKYEDPIVRFDDGGVSEMSTEFKNQFVNDKNVLDKKIFKGIGAKGFKRDIGIPLFKAQMSKPLETKFIDGTIDVDGLIKKYQQKEPSRLKDFGWIRETLERPDVVTEFTHKNHTDPSFNHIKIFEDKGKNKFFLTVTSDKTGKDIIITVKRLDNNGFKNIIDSGKEVFVSKKLAEKGIKLHTEDPTAHSVSPDAISTQGQVSTVTESISQNKGVFDGDTFKKAKAKGYEHIRKIVSDESLKEWGDASTAWRRNFTDTLGAEYHKIREGVTSSVNGETIKLERLHNALKELNESDRTALHNYVAGESKTIDKAIEPLAKKMKDDINKLSRQLVDREVLSEEAFKEWEHHYIHRSYEKYFMTDVKSLLNKGFKIDEIHKRGKTEILSSKKAREFANSVKPELLKRPLKDGGVRLKRLPNGKVELRRDWTQAERETMGEITDGAITIPETLMRLKRMNDNAKMFEDVANLDNVVLKDAEALTTEELDDIGYVLVPNSVKYGVLSQKIIRKDVLNDIQGINEQLFNTFGKDGALGRVWKSYLSTWKKSKTVWNVPSHVNNFMSNAFLMHLAGMSSVDVVTSIGRAGKMMIHGNAYEELLKKQMLGKATKKNLQDLAQMGDDLKYFIEAKEGGLLGRSQLNDILAGKQNDLAKKSVLSKLDKFAQDAYHNGDAINRIAMYSHLRQKLNLESDEARAMVLSVMPDYSKPMPYGYRVLRDTGISPFISWTYYTMPTVYKMIKTKQGAKQAAKAMGTLAALEWALTGGEITPLDNIPFMDTKKPEDYKGRRFGIGFDGDKITTLKTDRWIPYVELINPINFVVGQIGGPTTKALVNLGTSISKNGPIDTYTGRPITYNKGSRKVYDYMKYLTQSYVPLPAQAYTGWNIAESMLKDEKKRRTNKTTVPRTPIQEVAKFSGLNSLTYSKRGLKRDQRKDD